MIEINANCTKSDKIKYATKLALDRGIRFIFVTDSISFIENPKSKMCDHLRHPLSSQGVWQRVLDQAKQKRNNLVNFYYL